MAATTEGSRRFFLLALIPCEERKGRIESLIFIMFTEKTYYYITYWTYIYIHAYGTHNTVRK